MAVTFLTNEDEKKFVKSVNGNTPDENGNVEVSGGNVDLDTTLTESGKAADAKVVGDAIAQLSNFTLINQNGGGALKIWAGSQAEYDALLVKEDDVLYLIDGTTASSGDSSGDDSGSTEDSGDDSGSTDGGDDSGETGDTTTLSVTGNNAVALADITLASGYINDSGEAATLANSYYYDELIKAPGFCIVNSDNALVTPTSIRPSYYDADGNFLTRTYGNASNVYNSDATYVKAGFTYSGSYSGWQFIFPGTLLADYCTYSGYSLDASGQDTADTGSIISDYIPIADGLVGKAFALYNSGTMAKVAFYDADEAFISRSYTGSGYIVVEVPSDAKYVRFSTTASGTSRTSLILE